MEKQTRYTFLKLLAAVCLAAFTSVALAHDPLPSWNDGATKSAIVDFVKRVTDVNSPDFVPVSERIATFDNDGTLWTEHPMYTQLVFALDRVKALAPQHPEWKTTQPFQAVLDNDLKVTGCRRRERAVGAGHGFACRHEYGRFRSDCYRVV